MNRDIIAFTKYKFNVYGKKDIRSGRDSAVVGIVGKSKSLDFPTMLIFWSLVRNSVVLAVYLLFSVACFLTVHEHYRQVYLLISSLIVGFVVYSAGMIGFVGLIVPHVVRMLIGTDHKKLIPVTALVGAVFLVIADGLCRIIIPRTELPIGILISLIGAPCFVYLMIKRTYGFGGN